MAAIWLQFCVAAMRVANVPHTRPKPGRKTCGFSLVRSMFCRRKALLAVDSELVLGWNG